MGTAPWKHTATTSPHLGSAVGNFSAQRERGARLAAADQHGTQVVTCTPTGHAMSATVSSQLLARPLPPGRPAHVNSWRCCHWGSGSTVYMLRRPNGRGQRAKAIQWQRSGTGLKLDSAGTERRHGTRQAVGDRSRHRGVSCSMQRRAASAARYSRKSCTTKGVIVDAEGFVPY